MALCRECDNFLEPGKMLCRKCGTWTVNNDGTGTIGEAVKEDDFIDAVDVEAAAVERLITGGPWDEAWGGGFVPSSITLLGGAPGAGKSTLLLQLSIRVAEMTKKPTYYISAEQDKGELKMTLQRISLPLERGQLRMLKKFGAGGSIDEATLDKVPPGMIILDSVSALCGNDKHTQIAVAKRYKQYAVKYKAPTFLIAHMTKESDFAGLMALQHEVDVLVTLFPEDDGIRHIKAWKNRFGPTHSEFKLLMTEHGLIAPPPEPEKKGGQKKLMGLPPPPEHDEPPVPIEPRKSPFKRPVPDAIEVDGQKLVRRPKKGEKPTRTPRAAAIEGEALKRPRPPMPKVKPERAAKAKKETRKSIKKETRKPPARSKRAAA
jgi:predicted ATPase